MNVTIYGRTVPACVYCDRTKQFCLDRNIDFVFKDIVDAETKAELFERVPGVRTVPQIFIDDTHVGGFEDFVKHITQHEQGE